MFELNRGTVHVEGLNSRESLRRAKIFAREAADVRWYDELQAKYNVPHRDEEDYDREDLLTSEDHLRYKEILNEEQVARGA